MGEQPVWKVTLSGELDLDLVEEFLRKAPAWETGGMGLQLERVDVVKGSTHVFLSGSEVDARRLLKRIGEFRPKLVGRRKHQSCTVQDLHRTEPEKPPRPKRR